MNIPVDIQQYGEREFSLQDATERALTAVHELGLTAQFDGDQSVDRHPTLWRCQLFDATNNALPWGLGFGKGASDAARVGSLYEALEHYLTQLPPPNTVQPFPCLHIAQSSISTEAYAAILMEQPEQLISCRIYHQIDGTDTLAVPLFLSNVGWVENAAAPLRAQVGDTTDYRALARYSSNSGSATGGSVTEAAVHAINETIERDAFSLFLIRTFLATPPAPPVVIAAETLPDELGELLHYVQARIGQNVWLIDITTDLGVPSTLAYAVNPHGGYLRGYGTSLSRRYSVYRALTELLQVSLHEKPDQQTADHIAAVELLADYPELQKCAVFNLPPLVSGAARVPYRDTHAPCTPRQHLSLLVAKLTDRGFVPYVHNSHTFPNGIATVHVHIPGLEHFHLIVTGPCAVVPGQRGIAAATP